MKIKRDRLTVFIIGLIAGFIIGAYAIKLRYKTESNEQITEHKLNNLIKNIAEIFAPKANIAKQTIVQSNQKRKNIRHSRFSIYSTSTDNHITQDSSFDANSNLDEFFATYGENLDSLRIDSLSKIQNLDLNNNSSNIIVKKDELIMTKEFEINPTSSTTKKNLDSLLVEDKTGQKKRISIEFWKSPINYRGYKVNQNKIIIFGLNPLDNTTISANNNGYILTSKNVKYLLQISDSFLPLRKHQ